MGRSFPPMLLHDSDGRNEQMNINFLARDKDRIANEVQILRKEVEEGERNNELRFQALQEWEKRIEERNADLDDILDSETDETEDVDEESLSTVTMEEEEEESESTIGSIAQDHVESEESESKTRYQRFFEFDAIDLLWELPPVRGDEDIFVNYSSHLLTDDQPLHSPFRCGWLSPGWCDVLLHCEKEQRKDEMVIGGTGGGRGIAKSVVQTCDEIPYFSKAAQLQENQAKMTNSMKGGAVGRVGIIAKHMDWKLDGGTTDEHNDCPQWKENVLTLIKVMQDAAAEQDDARAEDNRGDRRAALSINKCIMAQTTTKPELVYPQ